MTQRSSQDEAASSNATIYPPSVYDKSIYTESVRTMFLFSRQPSRQHNLYTIAF